MKINTNLLLLFAALCQTGVVSGADTPGFRVVGLQIIREALGEEQNRLVPFNSFSAGTSLALAFESPTAIIKFDEDASKLDSFTDGKGTDLLTKAKGSFQNVGFGPFPKISEDGRLVLIEIVGGGVPAAGSTAIKAEGTLSLQTASQKKVVKSQPFDLVKGAAVKVGDIDLKLSRVEKPSFGDAALELEFETGNKAVTMLAGVKFLDPAGKELQSSSAGSSSMGFGNKYTYGRSFTLEKPVAGKVVLQFEVWTDLAEKKVPFSVTAGVGG